MSYILIAVLFIIFLIGVRYFLNHNRILGFLLLGTSAFGIYLVLYPNFSTIIANTLGVGRGADLLLYFLFLISILSLLINLIRINQNMRLITKLTRSIAIANPTHPSKPLVR
jgi:hypothetical protein